MSVVLDIYFFVVCDGPFILPLFDLRICGAQHLLTDDIVLDVCSDTT